MTHGMGGSDSIRAARFLMRTGRSFPVEAHPESASHFGIGARLTQVLGKQKTGWNGNSNRLYIQANSESTTTVRPRGRSGG